MKFLQKYVDQIQIFCSKSNENNRLITGNLRTVVISRRLRVNARNTVNDVHIIWRYISAISMPRNYGINTDTVVIFNIHCFVLDYNSVIWLHMHSL